MNIGVDFDGVILDDERYMRGYADLYSYFEINKPRLRYDVVAPEACFDWTDEEKNIFYEKYYDTISERCLLVPGAAEFLKMLYNEGHKLYIITMRGGCRKSEEKIVYKTIEDIGIKVEKIYWAESNKLDRCRKLSIDIMIDDSDKNVEKMKGSEINVIYFKDGGIREVKGDNITTVKTWSEIYNAIKNIEKFKR